MEITYRELMTIVHGMLFGVFFWMATFGLLVMLWRSMYERQGPGLTEAGHRWEWLYLAVMVVLGWGAVFTGAYIVYPWYRAAAPAGLASLAGYPKALLVASPHTAGWHNLGMEWKEHVAWMAPIAATAVAFVLARYKGAVEEHRALRRRVLVFAAAAFVTAGIAGMFGAMIDKAAPVTGGTVFPLEGGK